MLFTGVGGAGGVHGACALCLGALMIVCLFGGGWACSLMDFDDVWMVCYGYLMRCCCVLFRLRCTLSELLSCEDWIVRRLWYSVRDFISYCLVLLSCSRIGGCVAAMHRDFVALVFLFLSFTQPVSY